MRLTLTLLATAAVVLSAATPASAVVVFKPVHHFKHFHHFKPHVKVSVPAKPSAPQPYHHSNFGQNTGIGIMACVSGTVSAALVANYRNNRELTLDEAASCGLLYYTSGMNTNGNPPNLPPVTTCRDDQRPIPGKRYCSAG